MQVARIVTLLGIFSLASFSLNLHTGITGMTNFGVIFFVGVGAVVVGLLCAPVETNGYGWNPWMATIFAVSISAAAGWLLAYPTARLRMDYFAIVTISLGEMLRISLQAEPLLRAGTVTSSRSAGTRGSCSTSSATWSAARFGPIPLIAPLHRNDSISGAEGGDARSRPVPRCRSKRDTSRHRIL